ncbi:MAG TPA: hypothetical protein VGV13_07290 [Methylomirabilota bacterium]|jgi:hypothetical protein|nr:hypothetical protein [Methylomirabilota bacterium]
MSLGFTESLQQNRFIVVSADPDTRRVRLRSAADVCRDLSCGDGTIVVTEDGRGDDLKALNAGDIVRVTSTPGRPPEIVVVRRVWDELSSPEF